MATLAKHRTKAGTPRLRSPRVRPGPAGQARDRGNGARHRGSAKAVLPAGVVGAALARHTRVGLDTACFIYHLSNDPRYLPLTSALFSLIESGKVTAVTSSLTLVEILTRPKLLGHQAAVESYRVALATFPNLELRRSDIVITERAAELRARYRLATPVALQLATALVEGAQAFIGNAPALRAVNELEIILLEDLRAGVSTPSGRRA